MSINRSLIHICLMRAMLFLALPVAVQAQFTFTTNNGAITITGYTDFGDMVEIPSATNGYPVTVIGDYAFFGCTSLTSVTIPNSVTNIGSEAFGSCYGLTNVTIPASVTSIQEAAFSVCSSLTAINVNPTNPAYISIDGVLFNQNQTMLVGYPIGKTNTYYAIPNTVTDIKGYTFEASSLSSVTFGTNITNIGDAAFYGSSLTNVTIPKSVASVGLSAFGGCASLMAITVEPGNPAFNSVQGILFNRSLTTLIQYPGGLGGSYAIPDSVTQIVNSSFIGSGLTNIFVPNSVTNIEFNAFSYCNDLVAIIVDPANPAYRSVGGVLFDKNQTTLTFYPPAIPNGNYTIPNGVIAISENAFISCDYLRTVTIPNSVTNIGNNTFVTCIILSAFYFEGNAPINNSPIDNSYAFQGIDATVYYLTGTTGWETTYGGLPTALWLPQTQTDDGNFGVQSNHFGFNINWASGKTVVIEACTNLAKAFWSPIQTNTITDGSSKFSDPQWTNYPSRFYRFRSLQ